MSLYVSGSSYLIFNNMWLWSTHIIYMILIYDSIYSSCIVQHFFTTPRWRTITDKSNMRRSKYWNSNTIASRLKVIMIYWPFNHSIISNFNVMNMKIAYNYILDKLYYWSSSRTNVNLSSTSINDFITRHGKIFV